MEGLVVVVTNICRVSKCQDLAKTHKANGVSLFGNQVSSRHGRYTPSLVAHGDCRASSDFYKANRSYRFLLCITRKAPKRR